MKLRSDAERRARPRRPRSVRLQPLCHLQSCRGRAAAQAGHAQRRTSAPMMVSHPWGRGLRILSRPRTGPPWTLSYFEMK